MSAHFDITVLVKRCSRPGQDPKLYRAYQLLKRTRKPLGIQCSTTGDDFFAVKKCAGKAFRVLVPEVRRSEVDSIAERVDILSLARGQWTCVLRRAV